MRDYQDARRRFEEALDDVHSALLAAPEPFEFLSLSEKDLIQKIRRRFGLRLLEPPVRSLAAARRAHQGLRPDGGAA
jgi:hypothetical protein